MSPVWAVVAVVIQAGTVTVEASGPFPTVSSAISAAAAGDTVIVTPGVYREHLLIEKPLVLVGQAGAVLDGSGEGTVVTITASATIAGFTIRGSGRDPSREHSGIWADRADNLVVQDNVLEDVLFGVYVKQSTSPTVQRNTITGKALPFSRRGDGIRLWYSHDGRINHNAVTRVRDVVVWFSNDVAVWGNTVSDSRYGLHYMYSDRSWFHDNQFLRNEVGAFLMYSQDIAFENNVFANARGAFGKGLGFKDSEGIEASHNLLVKNAVGIYLDNSPHSLEATNAFRNNVIAFNDIGVTLLPSVKHNVFESNTFRDNIQPVAVTGGGTALANQWRDNFWSGYSGFDGDADGRGDSPFVHERVSDDLLAKHQSLKLFELSPAIRVLDIIGRVYPLLQPSAVVADSAPRLSPLALQGRDPLPQQNGATPWALLFLALSMTGAGAALRLRRIRGVGR